MTPQFNLLQSRFTIGTRRWVFGSTTICEGRSFIAITVRQGENYYADLRKVKGYFDTVWN